MTPKQIGESLFKEEVIKIKKDGAITDKLSKALSFVHQKNQRLLEEQKKQSEMIQRLQKALKQQLSLGNQKKLDTKIQERQINILVKDLNKTELLIEEISEKYKAFTKKNRKKSKINRVLNFTMFIFFLISIYPIYMFFNNSSTIAYQKVQISDYEQKSVSLQNLVNSGKEEIYRLKEELEKANDQEDLIALNKLLQQKDEEITNLKSKELSLIRSFKDNLDVAKNEYQAKISLMHQSIEAKLANLETQKNQLEHSLQKEKAKPKEMIVFQPKAESKPNNNASAILFEKIEEEKSEKKLPSKSLNLPSLADTLKEYGAKDAQPIYTTNPQKNFHSESILPLDPFRL